MQKVYTRSNPSSDNVVTVRASGVRSDDLASSAVYIFFFYQEFQYI